MPKPKKSLVVDQDKEKLIMTNLELTAKIKVMQENIDMAVKELHARDDEIKKLKDSELETKQKIDELKNRLGIMEKTPSSQKEQAYAEATRITTQNIGIRLKESGLTDEEQAAVLKKMS